MHTDRGTRIRICICGGVKACARACDVLFVVWIRKQDRTHKIDNQSMQNEIIVLRQENVDLRKDLNRLIKERNASGTEI